MSQHSMLIPVAGPWSLETSRRFWESFTPTAIPAGGAPRALHARFLREHDWTPADATITQEGTTARIDVRGEGDLTAAAEQVGRFLSLDVDATDWPLIGDRDPVVAAAQRALPGLRPCGFHSPYEAAAWAVLSQRSRVRDAAALRRRLIDAHGTAGAFPAPDTLIRVIDDGRLRLPGRKADYLVHISVAARDGTLTGAHLRALPEQAARDELLSITGIGPFAADLILIRGTNAVDVLPRADRRLDTEIDRLYGRDATLADVSEAWRPFRSWAAVHLRALREERTHEMA